MVRPGNAIQTFQPILPYRQLGSPLIRLTGDEFCGTAESSLYLLENINSAISGTALTNHSATFALDSDYGNIVASFSGAQYLLLPTESSIQVGTGSFVVSIAFKTNSLQNTTILSVGDQAAGKPYYTFVGDSASNLFFTCYDGTNTARAGTAVGATYADNKWHVMTGVLDTSSKTVYMIIDNTMVSSTYSTLNTLNVTPSNMVLGGYYSGGVNNNQFTGSLANFHLIKAADYNAIGVLNQGIREPVFNGSGLSVAAFSGTRLNNLFDENGGASGNYIYALINSEAGMYEIQSVYQTSSDRGIAQLQIDGKTVSSYDTYSSGATNNIVTKTYKVPLTEGQHLVKILSNTKNASSTNYFIVHQFINFIKRQGHEEGGVDNFLLLGDELVERSSNPITVSNDGNTYYASILNQTSSPANGDYTEGTLFIKGGLYRIDVDSTQFTDGGMVDFWIGNVQVLSQLDQYNALVLHNTITTKNVRLNQGKQVLRLAINSKNGSSSSYKFYINNIRALRLSD